MSKICTAGKFLLLCMQQFLLVTSQPVLAQPAYNFTEISTLNGLSSNTVNVILEDRNGITWIGTPNGLNKYNGTSFIIYRHDPDDSGSIPGNEVHALYQDKNDRLWIGTSNGLCYYDIKQNSFIRHEAFKQVPVRSICRDHLGNLWIGSFNDLRIINGRTGKVSKVPAPLEARRQENVWAVLSLFEDKNKRMWVGSQVGLYCYTPENKAYTPFIHKNTDPGSLSSNYVTGITQDSSFQVYFGGGRNKDSIIFV